MKRIALVTIGTLFFGFCLITMTRWWGLGQKHPSFQHPFFSSNSPLTIIGCESLTTCLEAHSKASPNALHLPVHTSADFQFFALSNEAVTLFLQNRQIEQQKNPTVPILRGAHIWNYDFATVQTWAISKSVEVTPLAQMLEAIDTNWVLDIQDNATDIHRKIDETLKDKKWDSKILINSQNLIVMETLKELRPAWIYGTSQADLMRFLTFDSLGILSAVQFAGDVFIAPAKLFKRPAFSLAGLNEARRRHKKILLGPISAAEEESYFKTLGADGYIYSNLEIQQKLNSK